MNKAMRRSANDLLMPDIRIPGPTIGPSECIPSPAV